MSEFQQPYLSDQEAVSLVQGLSHAREDFIEKLLASDALFGSYARRFLADKDMLDKVLAWCWGEKLLEMEEEVKP